MRRSSLSRSSGGRPVALLLVVMVGACLTFVLGGQFTTPSACQTDGVTEGQALAGVLEFVGPDAGDWHLAHRIDGDYVFKHAVDRRTARVHGTNGCVRAYDSARRTPPRGTKGITVDEAEHQVRQFISRSGMGVEIDQLVAIRRSTGDDARTHTFLFTMYRGDVELPVRVNAQIDVATGELLHYQSIDLMPLRVELTPTIPGEAATATAIAASRLDEPRAVGAQLFVWRAYWLQTDPNAPLTEEQALLWRVTLDGHERESVLTALHGEVVVDVRCTLEVDVDAATGEVRLCDVVWRESGAAIRAKLPPEPKTYCVFDQAPSWAGHDLLYFTTTRSTESDASDYERPERCTSIFCVALSSGETLSVIPDAFTYAPVDPAPSPSGNYLAFTRVRDAGLLNLRTGAIGRIGYHREGGQQPAWHPDGQQLAVTANRRGSQDIFRVKFDLRQLRSQGASTLSQLEENQFHPVYAPDGSWLAFTTEEGTESGNASQSVAVLHLDETSAPVGEPETIVSGLPRCTSMSAFPDGRRLFVCHEEGMEMIDIVQRTKSPVEWPVLCDPDLPDGHPLIARGAALSPDASAVAFSGLRWSGNPDDAAGWYIYVCDLDGSNLKRVTPLEDTPVEAYVYPETGKTAFDVAEELRAKFE